MIGKRLKSARKTKGWTQVELAKQANTAQSYIAQIEGNDREPSTEVLRSLADALEVSPGWLLGDIVRDMSAEFAADRAAIVVDVTVPPGLRDLARDETLCVSLDVQSWEWCALGSLKLPVPPTKDGYLLLLLALRASCPR